VKGVKLANQTPLFPVEKKAKSVTTGKKIK